MNIEEVVKGYDVDRLKVVTIASHSSLQILRSAKKLGLGTVAVAKPGVGWFYRRFNFIDRVIEVDFSEFERLADELTRDNAVLIPHGSYVEYVGWRRALYDRPQQVNAWVRRPEGVLPRGGLRHRVAVVRYHLERVLQSYQPWRELNYQRVSDVRENYDKPHYGQLV